MGTIIGALISGRDSEVTLLDTFEQHVGALNHHGAKVTGGLDATYPVKAITPKELTGQYDLIISTVKQTALPSALHQLLPFIHANSTVLTLQNGLPEGVASDVVGADRVIGGGMEFSGTFIEPGVVKLASPKQSLGVTIGEIDGSMSARLKQVQSVLGPIGHCDLTSQLRETRFTKLTDNCVCSAIPTALGCLLGEALDNPKVLNCITELGRECSKVMQALGIKPVKLFGFHPSPENIDYHDDEGKQQACDYWFKTYQPYRDQTASMLQDLRQDRPCEVDFINVAMLNEANKLGIDMPMNKKVIVCIKALEAQKRSLNDAWSNLESIT